MGLLGHRLCTCSTLLDTVKMFSKIGAIYSVPTLFRHIDCCQSDEKEWHLTVLKWISLITSKIQYLVLPFVFPLLWENMSFDHFSMITFVFICFCFVSFSNLKVNPHSLKNKFVHYHYRSSKAPSTFLTRSSILLSSYGQPLSVQINYFYSNYCHNYLKALMMSFSFNIFI